MVETKRFNSERLEIARFRRRLSNKALAEQIGVSPVTLTRLGRNYNAPSDATVSALARVLGFPVAFFYDGSVDRVSPESASFRSMAAMTATERDAALAAGSVAYLFSDWISKRFNLPESRLRDLSSQGDPAVAARILREEWGLGEQPVGSMIRLLESKGVRVFSLSENTRNVDAFSCWRNDEPYVFLNTFKSVEHSRFDAAHELGHLVLHRHGGPEGKLAESQANRFAAAFLMPEDDIKARIPRFVVLENLIRAKRRWGVSVSALAYRLHKLGTLSDWQYRTMCIEMNRRGYRQTEPDGMPREESALWSQVFTYLWQERLTKAHIASELNVPADEIENLVFGLTSGNQPSRSEGVKQRTSLQLVR